LSPSSLTKAKSFITSSTEIGDAFNDDPSDRLMAPPAAWHDKPAAPPAKSAQPPTARQQRRSPRSSRSRNRDEPSFYRVRRNGSFPNLSSFEGGEEEVRDSGRHPGERDRRRGGSHLQMPPDPSATFPYYQSHASRHQQVAVLKALFGVIAPLSA